MKKAGGGNTNLITDTNIWYDIGAGRRNPDTLKSGGNHLIATPTSFMEIASLVNSDNLVDRKKAAQAVVDHADVVIEDCESHLTKLWGFRVDGPDINWIEGFRAIAQTSSVSQLQKGVDDFDAQVTRRVNVALAKDWRTYQWDDFKNKVVDTIDQYVFGYKAARARGECRHLNKQTGEIFANTLRSCEVRKVLTNGTFWRALLVAGQMQRNPTQFEYEHAEPLVSPYVSAYIEYIIGCATKYAPQSNDLGDSDCFIYLQEGNGFLSSDKRWVEIALRACPSRCCNPEIKFP